MGAFLEKWLPLFLGTLSAVAYLIFLRPQHYSIPMSDILPTVINISAIAVGFLATASSILLTMPNRRVILKMKTAGLYQLIIDYLISSTKYCFILSVFSAVLLLFNWEDFSWWQHWLFAFWLFLSFTSLGSCYRVLPILARVLKLEL